MKLTRLASLLYHPAIQLKLLVVKGFSDLLYHPDITEKFCSERTVAHHCFLYCVEVRINQSCHLKFWVNVTRSNFIHLVRQTFNLRLYHRRIDFLLIRKIDKQRAAGNPRFIGYIIRCCAIKPFLCKQFARNVNKKRFLFRCWHMVFTLVFVSCQTVVLAVFVDFPQYECLKCTYVNHDNCTRSSCCAKLNISI